MLSRSYCGNLWISHCNEPYDVLHETVGGSIYALSVRAVVSIGDAIAAAQAGCQTAKK
jgi:hypothetical protein